MNSDTYSQQNHAQPKLIVAPQATVEKMKIIRAADNSVPLMEQFGISYNSWRKLQSGEPLRVSLVNRLIERFDREFS